MSAQHNTPTQGRAETATPQPPVQQLEAVVEEQPTVISPKAGTERRPRRRPRSTSTSGRATTPGPASRPQSRRAGATEAEVFGWQEERGKLEGENTALRKELDGLRAALRQAETNAEQWKEQAEEMEEEFNKAEKQRNEAERIVATRTIRVTTDGNEGVDEKLAEKCALYKQERDVALKDLEAAETKRRAEAADADRLAARVEALNTRLATARERAQKAEELAGRLQQERNVARATLETTTAERDDLAARANDLEEQVAELRGQVASLESSMARIGPMSPIRSGSSDGPNQTSAAAILDQPSSALATGQNTTTTSSYHSDAETVALRAKVDSLERKLAEEKHGRRLAEQERATFAARCGRDHVDAQCVLVRTIAASNPRRAEVWQHQLTHAFRWIKTELGDEDAEQVVAEAENEVFDIEATGADAGGDDAPSQQPGTGGQTRGAPTSTRLFPLGPSTATVAQPAAPTRRGGRTPPQTQPPQPDETTAPVGRTPPVALSAQERRHLETLARAADEIVQRQQVQAQQPAQPTVQPVLLQNLTIPQFSPKNARRWIDIVEGTFDQFNDAQATSALQKAMGAEFVKVADVYGHVPQNKAEWITAIRAVYPGDDPKVVANRVRNLTKNESETLEHFIRRGIQEARGTTWEERQIVDELIDVCWRPDTNYLNRHPRPTTTMELLEKARLRDKEQQEGRDPPKSASGKGKQPAPARQGDTAAGPKKATTAATYAETAAASETQGARIKTPTAKGNAGNKPQGSAESDVVTKKELAAYLSRFEETMRKIAAGQSFPQQEQQQQQAPRQAVFRTRFNPSIQGGRCFKCGEPGHGYRSCPQNPPPPCPVCKEVGHQPQQCPVVHGNTSARRPQRPAPTNAVGCQLCNETDHLAKNCPVLAAMAAGNQAGQGN